jgi:RNA polymerase sigma-70 factor (ECF subfamily)
MAIPEAELGVLQAGDEALVARARAGDGSAREELFRRHMPVARRVAHRLLGHEEDAADAVQEAAIKVFLNLDRFDGRSGFRTWFLRIVTNAARDIGRKRRRRPTLSLADGDPAGAEGAVEPDPAAGLHREDLRHALDAALARLSPDLRETFILRAEGDLSYEEIAACQDVPKGTVMSRLFYARQKLMASLEGQT